MVAVMAKAITGTEGASTQDAIELLTKTASVGAEMKLDRIQILQREIEDQLVTLQEVSSRLGDKVSLRSDKEERKGVSLTVS